MNVVPDTLMPVSRPLLSRLCLALLVSMSVLTVRLAGVHTHLCFDGQEEASAVHLADAGVHDEHAPSDEAHQDLELAPADGLAKNAKASSDTPLIFGADRLSSLAPIATEVATRTVAVVFPQAARLLRPPLRGPPL